MTPFSKRESKAESPKVLGKMNKIRCESAHKNKLNALK